MWGGISAEQVHLLYKSQDLKTKKIKEDKTYHRKVVLARLWVYSKLEGNREGKVLFA